MHVNQISKKPQVPFVLNIVKILILHWFFLLLPISYKYVVESCALCKLIVKKTLAQPKSNIFSEFTFIGIIYLNMIRPIFFGITRETNDHKSDELSRR